MIERHRRVDRALVAAVAEMYATGTSTRKVQRVAEKIGVSRLSKDQVSAIALEPGPGIEDLYGRPLEGSPVPYVWLDATYVKEPTLLRDCFPQDSQSNIIPKAYLKPSPTGA